MRINNYEVENISAKNNFYNNYTIKLAKGTRKILFSNLFLLFIVCLIILSTMFSIYYGAIYYGQSIFDAEYWSIGVILMTSITFVVAISGILGDLMMDRASRLALPFYIMYIVLYGSQCYFLALYYEMLQQMMVLILVIISLFRWGRKTSKEEDIKIKFLNKLDFLLLLIGLIVTTILLGSIMEWVINPLIKNASIYDKDGSLNYNLTPWWALRGTDPYPFLDAYVLIMFIGAWILFTKRYQNAFWVMFACIVGYFFVYGLMSFKQGISTYIVYFITNFVYLFLNQTGMSNWNIMYLEQEEKVKIKVY